MNLFEFGLTSPDGVRFAVDPEREVTAFSLVDKTGLIHSDQLHCNSSLFLNICISLFRKRLVLDVRDAPQL